MDILSKIRSPKDLKGLNDKELVALADEIRRFLIDKVSMTGGHLASNLGIVELTIALHYIFTTPADKIIWDVGHQSYVHKMLTGRMEDFNSLRSFEGLSGFPKVNESEHDSFNTGHSSTSISAALGYAKGRDLKGEDYKSIAVIGDGALTGGMSFEALNDTGRSPNDMIVILNDNEMSISKNVGGLSKYLQKIRTEPIYYKAKEDLDHLLHKIPTIGDSIVKVLAKIKGSIRYTFVPGMVFEELGFKYLGPVDGHDISQLKKILSTAKNLKGPVLIHVCTQKGRGYPYAEEMPHRFHGISPFEVETGEVKSKGGLTYSDVFGAEMLKLAAEDPSIVAITAAMPNGTGLDEFSRQFGNRLFDVGIAEQHAVTFAAGLSRAGIKPVVAIYSSFLQRAYDQILHDVCMQNLHVVFAIDRAGIVGEDGETHQGLFDISYLNHMPNMTILAPSDFNELKVMLRFALEEHRGPIAIRYPRGKGGVNPMDSEPIHLGKGVLKRQGEHLTLVAAGNMLELAIEASELLKQEGVNVEIIDPRFLKPLDREMIISSANKTGWLATLEDNTTIGGLGAAVLQCLSEFNNHSPVKTKVMGFPDEPIHQGKKEQIYAKYKLDAKSIAEKIKKWRMTTGG